MENNMKKCPKCGWEISSAASECPNCNYVFGTFNAAATNEIDTKKCPRCGQDVPNISTMCQNCNYNFLAQPNINAQPPQKKKNGFLIIILIFVGIFFLFSLFGDSEEEKDKNDKIIEEQAENTKEPKEGSKKKEDRKNIDDFSVGKCKIYNKNGVKVECTGNKEKEKFSLGLYAENNSKKDINIIFSGIAINNVTFSSDDINEYIEEEIMAGNKSNFSISIDEEKIKEKEIYGIKRIRLMLVLYRGDSDGIEISKTIDGNTKQGGSFSPFAAEIYSDENFEILLADSEGKRFRFSIFNKSGEYLDYYLDKCAINDYSFDLSESETNVFDKPIFPGTYSMFEIIVDNEFCEKNSIDKVDKIEFTIYAEKDPSAFSTSGEIKTKRITAYN